MLPAYLTEDRDTVENLSRQHCQTARLGGQSVLCRVLSKYIFYADADDLGLTPHLCLDGFWESWVTMVMARIIEPGWHCIDVGANQGYYTLLMADAVGETGRVLAIEPNPRPLEFLQLSLEVNGFLSQVEVVQKAVAECSGEKVKLVVPTRRAMDGTICKAAELTGEGETLEVETVTLDRLTDEWSRVDLIKIDAEGAEEKIWRGMLQTLRRNPTITIIMEVRCSRYQNPFAFARQIQSEGFRLRHIDYDGSIQELDEAQFLTGRANADWMMFLRRW
jgi:FkbM family methyltransferase